MGLTITLWLAMLLFTGCGNPVPSSSLPGQRKPTPASLPQKLVQESSCV